MAELVHIRLDPKMRASIRSIVADAHFTSETEFIRDAIRKNLETYERIQGIRRLQGTAKLRTPAERKKAEKELANMSSLDLFRAFGLDNLPEIRFVSRDDEFAFRSTRKRGMKRIREMRR